jgi:hypothetical protein
MNKTQHRRNERNVERVENSLDHQAGLQALDPVELANVEGGRFSSIALQGLPIMDESPNHMLGR